MTGPRGRYLCWSILWSAMADAPQAPVWDRVWAAAQAGGLSGRAGDLAAAVGLADLAALAAAADELVLVPALADTAAMAMYWQEPDPVDGALRDHRIQNALLPIARAVAQSPAARWWAEPVAREAQRYVEWAGAGHGPARLSGASGELAAWRSATLAEERSAARRPADPAANWSGHWWSAPAHSRLAATTRALPGLGAVGLALVEDGPGWTKARCQPVRPRPAATVCEITGPDDWAQLAARYPLDVTRSRRHDWWRVTGWTGTWPQATRAPCWPAGIRTPPTGSPTASLPQDQPPGGNNSMTTQSHGSGPPTADPRSQQRATPLARSARDYTPAWRLRACAEPADRYVPTADYERPLMPGRQWPEAV